MPLARVEEWVRFDGQLLRRGRSPRGLTQILAGAMATGAADYPIPFPIPASYRFCDFGAGNDSTGDGSIGSPWKTTSKAYTSAPAGGTVVLRGGSYLEGSLSMTDGKSLTVQNMPGEAVYIDGGVTLTGWTNVGTNLWRASYTALTRMTSTVVDDYNGTLTVGGDATASGIRDQVWVDDAWLNVAADNTSPAVGSFSVDRGSGTVTIGLATNPAGHTIKATSRPFYLTMTGPLHFRGIEFRHFAPTHPDGSNNAVFYCAGSAQGFSFEHCSFRHSVVAGLTTGRTGTIRSCTFEECGQTGLHATTADDILIEKNLFRHLNRRRWSAQPVCGGYKITRTDRGIARYNYTYDVPLGMGNWWDVSNRDIRVYCNVIDGTDKGRGAMDHALEVELSDGGTFAGVQATSYVVNNDVSGGSVALSNLCSGHVRYWNNRFRLGSVGQVRIQQDRAGNDGGTPANNTAAESPWRTTDVWLVNNDIGYSATGGGLQVYAYDDRWDTSTEDLLGIEMLGFYGGNWNRPGGSGAGTTMQLGDNRMAGLRTSFNTASAIQGAGSSVGGPWGAKLGPVYVGTTAPDPETYGVGLSAEVASMLGQPAGTKVIGLLTDLLPVPIDAGV